MCTTVVSCSNLVFINGGVCCHSSTAFCSSLNMVVPVIKGGRRACRLVSGVKRRHSRDKSWWEKLFSDDDGNWVGFNDKEMVDVESESSSEDELLSEGEKFEAWKRRAEAIVELREAQDDMRNEENRRWEDWLVGSSNVSESSSGQDWINGIEDPGQDFRDESIKVASEKGLIKLIKKSVGWEGDDELVYEDRVFQFASVNSAKFLVVLLIIPSAIDFLVHDYVLMPFLDRYVKTVPLAAEIFDVRKHQKLEMVKEIKLEKARFQFEVVIGKSPPLSDEELWLELRHKALKLRDEWRLKNRQSFANIWSDMVFGISVFLLLYFNESKVALLKFTGYKIINNISDTGKAFLIILITDIFLGYHSEPGWRALVEGVVEHYGVKVDRSAIIIFVSTFPVIIDACVKLWLFKFLPRMSPGVASILKEIRRH